MTADPEGYRAASRDRWERAAGGWETRRAFQAAAAQPVAEWMVDAIAPEPGQTVLELTAGVGDTGFLAAQRLGPEGRLITTDGAEAMLDAAKRRAAELGLGNVEFRTMEAEWIDLSTASVDAVLCRWGYMLLVDPEAALRETRRVLRPGGRVALAAWDAVEHNPWVTQTSAELVERGLAQPPDPDAPSMFSFAAPGRIEELLLDTGFDDVAVEAVDVVFRPASFDDWWEFQFDTSLTMAEALAKASPEERDAVHEAVEARLAQWRSNDGSLALPGRTLVASAIA